jgi:hypothetical protein
LRAPLSPRVGPTAAPEEAVSAVTRGGAAVAALVARRYLLVERLGAGGHGEVWTAEDRVLGEQVAVKRMRPGGAAEPARVRREIAALRLLALPGVVRLLDEGTEDDGRPFFVMERVEGAPFPGAPRTPRWSWSALAERTVALLEVLARVHAAGVVHRDLKPGNVLVSAEGRPIVLDFGLSRGAALGGDLTVSGQIVGTPAYLAPEQMLGQAVDARTDLYAVGVMLYEALAGHRPHEADDLESLYRAHLLAEARPLAEVAPEVPRSVARAVDRLLARSPDHRPRSCAEAIDELTGPNTLRTAKPEAAALPWLGSLAPIHAVLEAARAKRSVDIAGPPGAGRSRCLEEAIAALRTEGFDVLVIGASRGPFSGLQGVAGLVDGDPSLPLEELVARVDGALRDVLARGAVVVADDAERIDRWSAAALERCRDAGTVVRALSAASPGAVLLAPLDEHALGGLFEGPDRLFHLREDAARALWDRSHGLPSRVADELAAWVRAGLVRRDGARFAVEREALDRLAAGLIVSAPRARAAWQTGADTAHLEDLLMWIALASSPVTPANLAAATGQPRWRVEAEMDELVVAGAARRRRDGRVEAARQADAAWTATRRRDAHAALARVARPGEEGRLYHLIATGNGEAIIEEAMELGRRRAIEGRMGAAAAAFSECLHATRQASSGSAQAEARALSEWVKSALADGTPKALDRVMYELHRASECEAAEHLRALVGAAISAAASNGERALAEADAVPRFDDPELEQRRHRVRLLAARRCSTPQVHATLLPIETWAATSSAVEAHVTLAEARGFLCYEQGRFAAAAMHHAEAARADRFLVTRIGAMLNGASSLLEAFRHEEAAARAGEAEGLAAGCRHAYYEGRAAWLERAALYRMGAALETDRELLDAVARVGVVDLEANVCLVEGVIAYRRGDESLTVELAERAARAWRRMGKGWAEILALALAAAARRSATDQETTELAARAIQSNVPGIGAQVLGLLALARPDRRAEWRPAMAPLCATIHRENWHLRMDLGSLDEARSALGLDGS